MLAKTRLFASLSNTFRREKHTLPALPYAYNALEPIISGEIMQLHHQKHHHAYVTNLNASLEKYEDAQKKNDIGTMISLEPAIRFNGGGHINHSIFWKNLAPKSSSKPKGELMTAIEASFGKYDTLIERMTTSAVGVQGSGWAWLAFCPRSRRLLVSTCANQDPLESTTGNLPLLGIDVWEHAYYLQYKNVRADYVKAIWQVINWDDVAERYARAAGKR